MSPEGLKKMVGGDIITLKTSDNESALAEIRSLHAKEGKQDGGEIVLETDNGEEFIPVLVSSLKTRILSISMRRPTLDDVFLKLTGREIREEGGGEAVMLKQWTMRQAGSRGGRFR